mmetsp:Transcript_9839/g.14489  ORF Transcript_9839/g.14489 Transcript_9839/m.14489 type:complete len:82 (-) Transcript_9839:236-481(-)
MFSTKQSGFVHVCSFYMANIQFLDGAMNMAMSSSSSCLQKLRTAFSDLQHNALDTWAWENTLPITIPLIHTGGINRGSSAP